MWFLVVFCISVTGQPSLDIYAVSTEKACQEAYNQASTMLSSPGNTVKNFYLECKKQRVA